MIDISQDWAIAVQVVRAVAKMAKQLRPIAFTSTTCVLNNGWQCRLLFQHRRVTKMYLVSVRLFQAQL
jgi:hypothetical protein